MIYVPETATQFIYRNKNQVHKIETGEEVILFLHQTNKGEPYTNVFTVSAYKVPPHLDPKDVVEELKKSIDNLCGFTRILSAKIEV